MDTFEHWEKILYGLGALITTILSAFGIKKGYKAYQRNRDNKQDKRSDRIEVRLSDLEVDMGKVKGKQNFIVEALDRNAEEDLVRDDARKKDYAVLQGIVSDTNNTVKEIQKELKDDDKETIKRLRDQLDKRK